MDFCYRSLDSICSGVYTLRFLTAALNKMYKIYDENGLH